RAGEGAPRRSVLLLELIDLQREVEELGFARVVAVQAPFLEDVHGELEALVVELVERDELAAGLGLEGEHEPREDPGGVVGRVRLDEATGDLDGVHGGGSSWRLGSPI